jgi:hypothetical protein
MLFLFIWLTPPTAHVCYSTICATVECTLSVHEPPLVDKLGVPLRVLLYVRIFVVLYLTKLSVAQKPIALNGWMLGNNEFEIIREKRKILVRIVGNRIEIQTPHLTIAIKKLYRLNQFEASHTVNYCGV